MSTHNICYYKEVEQRCIRRNIMYYWSERGFELTSVATTSPSGASEMILVWCSLLKWVKIFL